MNKSRLYLLPIVLVLSVLNVACNSEAQKTTLNKSLKERITAVDNIPFDSTQIISFYHSYPGLEKYEKDAAAIYRKQHYNYIWSVSGGVTEYAHALFVKFKMLESEGVTSAFPYPEKIEGVFIDEKVNAMSVSETELMLTNLFLFIVDKKILGIDGNTVTDMGWLLPRKKLNYNAILDSLLKNPFEIDWEAKLLLPQSLRLRDHLRRYREIEKKGGWESIELNPKLKAFKPGDTAKAILQIRQRLFLTGELKQNNGSKLYDAELAAGIRTYELHNGKNPDRMITPGLIRNMNIPVGERIKKIMINMERCRWISPEIFNAKEFILVNIPSFQLNMYQNGNTGFSSRVVVGKTVTKTVIFAGAISHIVFSPWWNLPPSIIKKEVMPAIKKNPDYLAAHNMEWNNGDVRQRPGKTNSLGLVKFMFPNSNDIYMHDTPSKSLFERESRAFSHGCIRVARPRDLALTLLIDDSNWTPERIDAAMNAGVERTYMLRNKMPVYIGYFTAWVNEKDEISFYDDIYQMDEKLTKLLIE